ncbi:S-layer homology domain-containing protein [Chungangia koreensis]|uniref:S-layer homology domain-containing protein n=1 Tax=Chungangia koreensis TaxID=752657 RepID=A0ABV8X1H2_9LACT
MKLKKSIVVISLLLLLFAPSFSALAAFTDVNDRYRDAVNHIVNKKYAQGQSDTQFGVSDQIKRIDAAVMIARVNGFTPDTVYPNAGFTDVPKDRQWAVNALAANGIMNGINSKTFGSYQSMTREQMAKVIALTYDLQATSYDMPFTDVLSTVKPYVAALLQSSITQGKTATTFGSKENITRGEFALFIYRAESNVTLDPPEVISVE